MSESIVRSALDHHKRVPSHLPSRIAQVFDEVLLEDGTMGLKETGKHDLNDFVQASKDATLIYNLLDRFQQTQDPSIFSRSSGFYADVTQMPKDLMEAQNLLLSIDKRFAQLPADIKDKFDNNSHKFAEAVLSGEVDKIFGESAVSDVDAAAQSIGDDAQKEVKDESK